MNDENKNQNIDGHESRLHEIEREHSPVERKGTGDSSGNPVPVVAPQTPTSQGSVQASGPIGSITGQVTDAEYQAALQSTPLKRPSRWRYVFIVLGVLQLLGVAAFFGFMYWASVQASQGVSGTEFLALMLFVTLVPAVGIVAFLNFIGLPIYLLKQKPKGKGLILGIISLIISMVLVAYAGYNAYQLYVVLPNYTNDRTEQSRAKAEQYAAEREKASYEITKEEAIGLLQSCQLKGFYMGGQTDKDNGGWGELSSTGVVATDVDDKPYRISIADRLVPELEPIAREAQRTCGGPQFSRDGMYEQRQADGTWR